ncbi:hypothetical protein GPECTOR_5g134 [Gonium pectorale]|uniref:Uncharacterized protein n=1 Tax=Gonium pectorale TaxID=33097 RepID=A0A150GW44_GONPE|nr:hypothetical protein GPECTOR_5g134 [Gonium pectorale]|eukprot:KXZ54024.1 hypothetical protein GPECTOR_5g134 [Gonium pectorale]
MVPELPLAVPELLVPELAGPASAAASPHGYGVRALRAALRQALSAAGSLWSENRELKARLAKAEGLLAAAGSSKGGPATPSTPGMPTPPLTSASPSGAAASAAGGAKSSRRLKYDTYDNDGAPVAAAAAAAAAAPAAAAPAAAAAADPKKHQGRYVCLGEMPLGQWWGARGRAVTVVASFPSPASKTQHGLPTQSSAPGELGGGSGGGGGGGAGPATPAVGWRRSRSGTGSAAAATPFAAAFGGIAADAAGVASPPMALTSPPPQVLLELEPVVPSPGTPSLRQRFGWRRRTDGGR